MTIAWCKKTMFVIYSSGEVLTYNQMTHYVQSSDSCLIFKIDIVLKTCNWQIFQQMTKKNWESSDGFSIHQIFLKISNSPKWLSNYSTSSFLQMSYVLRKCQFQNFHESSYLQMIYHFSPKQLSKSRVVCKKLATVVSLFVVSGLQEMSSKCCAPDVARVLTHPVGWKKSKKSRPIIKKMGRKAEDQDA